MTSVKHVHEIEREWYHDADLSKFYILQRLLSSGKEAKLWSICMPVTELTTYIGNLVKEEAYIDAGYVAVSYIFRLMSNKHNYQGDRGYLSCIDHKVFDQKTKDEIRETLIEYITTNIDDLKKQENHEEEEYKIFSNINLKDTTLSILEQSEGWLEDWVREDLEPILGLRII